MGSKVENGDLSHRFSLEAPGKCLCPPAWTNVTAQQAPLCSKVKGSEAGPGQRSGGWDEGRLSISAR